MVEDKSFIENQSRSQQNIDVFFSIYPNPSDEQNQSNFSIQIVNKEGYYPPELEFLSTKIIQAETPIELERAIERFTEFINTRKDELVKLYKQNIKREKINQRAIYCLTTEDSFEALYNYDQSDLVYLAGPLGGGKLNLDHELKQTPPKDWLSLIKFDNNHIGEEIDEVQVDKKFGGEIIKSHSSNKLRVIDFPITIDHVKFRLVRSKKFFQQKFESIATINDFAPMIDSGLTAAEAILSSNNRYLTSLPSIVSEKINQYSMDREKYYPNFLGIQEFISNIVQNSDDIKIEGFTTDKPETVSFVKSSLYNGLKVFLLGNVSFNAVKKVLTEIQENKELKWELDRYHKEEINQGTKYGTNKFGHRQNEVIRQSIGLKSLQSNLVESSDAQIGFELPIGFAQVNFTDTTKMLITSYEGNELPLPYFRILEDYKNAFDLITTGPLDQLNITTQDISLILKVGDYRLKVKYIKEKEHEYGFIVSLLSDQKEQLEQILHYFNHLNSENIQRKDNLSIEEIRNSYGVKQKLPLNKKFNTKLIQSNYPLATYLELLLDEFVVDILLKRILKEIRNWETEEEDTHSYETTTSTNQPKENLIEKEFKENEFVEDEELNTYILERKQIVEEDTDYQLKMRKLEKEMNDFNPGLFNFFADSLKRDQMDLNEDTKRFYTKMKSIFEDLKVALIDFGLTPMQWYYADNLQLWNSYNSQIKFLKHSLIVQLREHIGETYDGENLKLLIKHDYTDSIDYHSYDSSIEGDRYIQLKRTFLGFGPKLEKHRDEIGKVGGVKRLIEIIEELERNRKAKIKSQLPNLPTKS